MFNPQSFKLQIHLVQQVTIKLLVFYGTFKWLSFFILVFIKDTKNVMMASVDYKLFALKVYICHSCWMNRRVQRLWKCQLQTPPWIALNLQQLQGGHQNHLGRDPLVLIEETNLRNSTTKNSLNSMTWMKTAAIHRTKDMWGVDQYGIVRQEDQRRFALMKDQTRLNWIYHRLY